MTEMLIKKIERILNENKDGVSINQIANKLNINRFMLSGYLNAYAEVGYLRKMNMGASHIFKMNENRRV